MNDRLKQALKIALSGAVTGGVLGAGGKMLGGARGLGSIARSGAIGAGLGGAVAGGSSLVGNAILGQPEDTEVSPNALRGLLGGALAGAAVGGGLGGLGAAGKLAVSESSPAILRKLASFAQKELPLDNILTDYISKATPGKGALAGGAALGAIGGFEGMDEGLSYDALQRQIEEKRRDRMRQEMAERAYAEVMANGY